MREVWVMDSPYIQLPAFSKNEEGVLKFLYAPSQVMALSKGKRQDLSAALTSRTLMTTGHKKGIQGFLLEFVQTLTVPRCLHPRTQHAQTQDQLQGILSFLNCNPNLLGK